jgi:hypothetical protein
MVNVNVEERNHVPTMKLIPLAAGCTILEAMHTVTLQMVYVSAKIRNRISSRPVPQKIDFAQ